MPLIPMAPFAGYVIFYTYSDLNKVNICLRMMQYPDPLPQPDSFFGRAAEVKVLQSALEAEPHRILVVTGPSDSGKSSLVAHVLNKRQNTIFVDLRSRPITSLHDFCTLFNNRINAQFLNARTWLMDWLPIQGTFKYATRNRLSMVDLQRSLATLTDAIKAAHAQRLRLEQQGLHVPIPVVCFDEFGTLLDFVKEQKFVAEDTLKVVEGTKEAEELVQTLLSWAVHITKELGAAHVLISSSDSFAISKIHQFKGLQGRTKFLPIGDLPPAEAKRFLNERLHGKISADEVNFAVENLGGRFLDLLSFANEVKAGSSTPDVIDTLVSLHRERLLQVLANGVASAKDDSKEDEAGETGDEHADARPWETTQLWTAMKQLAATDSGAVPYNDLKHSAFGGNKDALTSLIASDVLGWRYALTPDLDPKAAPKPGYWVTMDAPSALAAARQLVADDDIASWVQGAEKAASAVVEETSEEDEWDQTFKKKQALMEEAQSVLGTLKLIENLPVKSTKDLYADIVQQYTSLLSRDLAIS